MDFKRETVAVSCVKLKIDPIHRCSTWWHWRRNHYEGLAGGVLQMATKSWDVPLQNCHSQPGDLRLNETSSLGKGNIDPFRVNSGIGSRSPVTLNWIKRV